MSDTICGMSAIKLIEAYRSGSLSPVEVTAAIFKRIAEIDPKYNAFCQSDQEKALDAAKCSEYRWRNREPIGRIDGVPVTVKDLVIARDYPTLRGSETSDKRLISEEDAPAVARLREHGGIIIGKTTTPEYGWKGVTDSPLTGVTLNPWNINCTSGGSSGGAAVAALCGMGPLHIGTDGGGSVRIPAAFCGIVGIKANFGRVPVYPASPFGTLSHLGPMTRDVEDAALMLTVMAEPDPRDAFSLPFDGRDYSAALGAGVCGLRVAYSPDLGYANVDPQVAFLVEKAAKSFEELGATVEVIKPIFDNPQEIFRTHWYAGAAHVMRSIPEAKQKLVDPGLRYVAEKGSQIDMDTYLNSALERAALVVKMRKFHQKYDILLTPTMPVSAFMLGNDSPIGGNGESWDDWSPFTYPFNLTGQPAATIPCGFTKEKMPVGLQIIGANYDEATVLRCAFAFQTQNPPREGLAMLN